MFMTNIFNWYILRCLNVTVFPKTLPQDYFEGNCDCWRSPTIFPENILFPVHRNDLEFTLTTLNVENRPQIWKKKYKTCYHKAIYRGRVLNFLSEIHIKSSSSLQHKTIFISILHFHDNSINLMPMYWMYWICPIDIRTHLSINVLRSETVNNQPLQFK